MPTWEAVLIGVILGVVLIGGGLYILILPELLGRKSRLPKPTDSVDAIHRDTNITYMG
ncbi:hypothetical protein HDIA_2630 [Hartmannibacter diazotrophicus]|uniref:Uncharacterized protein n=1 Tax=Hartmannibacter diazotrophicus TaxID=1482074 RepID=A0A2C9D8V8_9HYPH|nr:hypothetical protein HDIA_2630 [Hartmannibacter diazotrophicus]